MERNKKGGGIGSDLLKIGLGLLAGAVIAVAGKVIADKVQENDKRQQ